MSALIPGRGVGRLRPTVAALLTLGMLHAACCASDPGGPSAARTRIAAAVAEALLLALDRRPERIEVDVVSVPTALAAEGEAVPFRVRPLAPSRLPPRRLTVWIDVLDRGHAVRSTPAAVRVRAYDRGWVAREDLPAGTTVSPEALSRELVDIAGSAPAFLEDPVGRPLRRAVRAGQYIAAGSIGDAFAVGVGQPIDIRLRTGGIEVLARGMALQDGCVGQEIPVRVASAEGRLRARVVSNEVAEILQ